MSAQTIVISGANRGIGLEFTRIFRQRGDRVIALCRRAGEALRNISIMTTSPEGDTLDHDDPEPVQRLPR